MGAAGRALAQERYSWDAIGRRLVGIYDGVIGRTQAPAAAAS